MGRNVAARLTIRTGAVAIFAVASCGAASAKSATGGGDAARSAEASPSQAANIAADGDIVVTARRREESLQRTPISITALTSQAIADRQLHNLTDIGNFVPNLNLLPSTSFGSSSTAFAFIRGVGQSEVFVQNDPGVGIYVDGIYVGRSQGAVFDVIDLERVEVLRGPQGTLYGRNTIGGAINLVSRPPSPETSYSAWLEAGNYGTINGNVRLNGALADNVYASLSVATRNHDGYVRALPNPLCTSCTRQSLSDEHNIAARGALRFQPSNDLTIDLAADYTRRQNRAIGTRVAYYNDFVFVPYDFAVLAQWGVPPSVFADRVPDTHQASFAGVDHQRVWGASARVQYQAGQVTLRSITGYRGLHVLDSADNDGSPLAVNSVVEEITRQHQLSQEFQLLATVLDNRLDLIGGLYGYTERAFNSITQAQRFAELSFFTFGPSACFNKSDPILFGCGINGTDTTHYAVDNLAGYLNGTFHITPRLSISGGLRYNYERKHFVYSTTAFPPAPSLDLTASFESLTPRAGIEFQATPHVLLYASYAQGFKSGSFNNGNDPRIPPGPIRPERVEAYEAGLKTSGPNNLFTFNIAGFYSNYRDQQLLVQTDVLAGSRAFVNVGSSVIYGGEAEFTFRPSPYFHLDGGVGYTHTRIDNVDIATPNVREGARLAHVPRWTVNLGGELRLPVAARHNVLLRLDYAYKSSQEGNFLGSPGVRVPGYDIVNGRLTYAPVDRHWEVYLFASNLFDKRYEIARSSFDPSSFAGAVDGAPRTFGVGARVHF